MGARRGSRGRSGRRAADWLDDEEGEGRDAEAAPAQRQVAASHSGTKIIRAPSPQRRSIFRRLRSMETPGMPRLARRHKLALAAAALGTFLIFAAFMQGLMAQLGNWGYLGAFLISLATSATILLPAPGAAIIMLMAKDFNPFLLGAVAGFGAGLGALTAYGAGVAGRNAIRHQRMYAWLVAIFRSRWGPLLLFIFSAVPFLPMDLVSAMAGAVHYPVPKYLLYVTSASIVKMVTIALLGAFATAWLLARLHGLLA
ncbi:MAG: hypothetical protein HY688_03620 [Chloroflexi bacterium]|nr:hypothetical protein [Chloroflexota bacterium]